MKNTLSIHSNRFHLMGILLSVLQNFCTGQNSTCSHYYLFPTLVGIYLATYILNSIYNCHYSFQSHTQWCSVSLQPPPPSVTQSLPPGRQYRHQGSLEEGQSPSHTPVSSPTQSGRTVALGLIVWLGMLTLVTTRPRPVILMLLLYWLTLSWKFTSLLRYSPWLCCEWWFLCARNCGSLAVWSNISMYIHRQWWPKSIFSCFPSPQPLPAWVSSHQRDTPSIRQWLALLLSY